MRRDRCFALVNVKKIAKKQRNKDEAALRFSPPAEAAPKLQFLKQAQLG
jgi:hypothetical protein